MNTMTKTNGRHTNGASQGNGNGRAVLTETIPTVQVLSPDGPDAPALNGVSEIPDCDLATEPDAIPHGNSEGESEQASSGAPLSLPDWLKRHREQLPPRRYDWPADAERPRERLKYKQARAVDLLVFGMTVTDVAAQLGVNRGTVHRWRKDPIFVAQLEARRSELADSLLDLHMLGNRIGLGKLLELVESTNDSLALRAATTLVNSGQRAYQSIDEKKRIERLEDNMGMVHGLKV
jgi:transposase-like protein